MIMDSERFNPNNEQDAERANLERQKKKLVGFYLSGGDENYIFNSNNPRYSEDEVTPEAEESAIQHLRDGFDFSRAERDLLLRMQAPNHVKGMNGVFEDLSGDKQQKRILGYMTGEEWGDFDKTSGSNVSVFLSKYPTPLDFESTSDNFITMMGKANGEEKAEEYREAMDNFQKNVYGKRYEYYKAMKEIHEATKKDQVGATGRLSTAHEAFNQEKVVRDAGARTANKGNLIGNPNRANEDAAYYDPENALFGVFDGAGGEAGASRASGLASGVMAEAVREQSPNTMNDLASILSKANDTIKYDTEAGYSTAVVGKIVEDSGGKKLLWASMGDSRIYLIRESGPAIQITTDEGEGSTITNALGAPNGRVNEFGEVPLHDGDRIMFCSDGITGDVEKDFIPNDELANIVRSANTADDAAIALINRATKIDDRTAVVVQV